MEQRREDEDKLLRSVVLQNAQSILAARQRAEEELVRANEALELKTEELAHSLAVMRATLESTTDGILVTDASGKVTGFNEIFAQMWRLPREVMDTREHRQLLGITSRYFSDPQQFLARIEDIYTSSPPESDDLLELADGRVIERFSRIQFVAERNVGRVWSFRDITERRRAEEALRKQSEWLNVTLSSIGDAVVATDTEGKVSFLNGVAQKLTGWTQEEAKGRSLNEVFRIINEESREPVGNPAERALQEGGVVGLANHTILIAKDGTETPIDDSAAPIRDENGHVHGAVLVFRDVSERKEAENSLRRSEQELAEFFENATVGLHWVGPDGTILRVNRSELQMLGYSREEYVGRHIAEFHADKPVIDEILRRLHAKEELCEYEARLRCKDGSIKHVLINSNVQWENGKFIHTRCFTRDVTDRQRVEEANATLLTALKEGDRRKDEFLAILAHELRNPLAPIGNSVQILRAKSPPVPELQWATEVIDRQVHQMTRLVDDLLDVSRITRGKIELRKERLELSAIVNSAVEASRPLIEKWGHQLTVAIPHTTIHIEGDLTRLAQVLLNLLNNAAKYMNYGGRIWLTAEPQSDHVLIRVKDTGLGIPKEKLPRIFDMFTQVESSLERSQGGLGIGLTLVQRLVEMHGGTVEARSDGPGKGSEFVVRLPVAREAKGVERHPAAGDGEKVIAVARRRILVVDDNRDAADSLGMILRSIGNEVHTAYDGLLAVEAATAFRPDFVLLDIGLPKLNGYEVARRIREQAGGSSIVLVAITGWGQEEDRRRTKEAGFDHHLTKPVEFDALQKLLTVPKRENS